MLQKILANILNHSSPEIEDNLKYRRLKLSNAKLQEKLFGLEGAAELLVLVGFTQVWKPEEIFFFPPEALLSPLQELYTQLDGELAALFDSA